MNLTSIQPITLTRLTARLMEYSQQNVQKVIEQQPRESRIDRRRTSWRRMIRASSRFPDRSWRAAIIIDNGPADRQAESNGHGADRYSFPLRTDNTRIVIASSFARFSATFFVRVRRLFIGPSPAPILEESNSNPVLPLLSHSLRKMGAGSGFQIKYLALLCIHRF